MNIYEQLGLKTIINASDTYTRIGGSRMSDRVMEAMCEAGKYFVDITELGKTVSSEIARMTRNEAAFISSGAAACIVLTASWLMTEGDSELVKMIPDTSKCKKKEFIVFHSQTTIQMLPYWHLIELSGAKLIKVGPTLEDIEKAIGPETAGIYFFAADIYESGLPPVEDVIALARAKSVRIIIDAAAQLPPKSNLWYYTKELGADGVIFSGGKFIMGPQSTGLFLGNSDIAEGCYKFACPNVSIGRPFKVGKEELIGIYAAVKQFVEADAEQIKKEQNAHLDAIENALSDCADIAIRRVHHGRLAQDVPMLIIDLPESKTGAGCAAFMLDRCNPAIDIGYYLPDDKSGTAGQVFINSINLRENELIHIAESLKLYLAQ